MEITLNMEDAIKKAKEEGWPENMIVNIEGNFVTVKLREKGGYSYSFFNNVEVNANFDSNLKGYYFVVDEINDKQ